MNTENLLRVADAIEKHEIEWLGFDMELFIGRANECGDTSGHSCGTTGCIAGWAYVVSQPAIAEDEFKVRAGRLDVRRNARTFLGLTDRQADNLFEPENWELPGTLPSQAIRTLRHAAEHGVIDWNAANAEPAS